jgi:alkanesulfonate monooxygenase SsuD/methylene tetrahydromethanopterin reductase-like flavin-dependent oxidoreductase (luciferase family)
VRSDIPVYLAAVGPKNLELTGEIADGWLAIFFSPEHAAVSLQPLRAGRSRAQEQVDGTDVMAGFDVVPTVPVVFGDDVERCADAVRQYTALYVGGMGSKEQNFYNALARRMGFEAAAEEVQRLFLDRKHREAAAVVPFELINATALIGPPERVRDRLHAYAEAGVTTLSVATHDTRLDRRLHTIRTMAELLDESGLAA